MSETDTLHCAKCDYDLRLLDPAGVCPECALPIEQSVVAAADPIGPGRRTLRAAVLVLLGAMALRLAVTIVVAIDYEYVFLWKRTQDVVNELLNPWPADLAVQCAILVHRDFHSVWTLTRAPLALSFAAECVGVWMLTRAIVLRNRGGITVFLRHLTRWSAIISLALFALLRIQRELHSYRVDWIAKAPVLWALEIVPPVSLALWTAQLFAAATRDRRRRHRLIGRAAVLCTFVAAALEFWRYRSFPPWESFLLLSICTIASFMLMLWMWWTLRRRARAPREGPATIP